jgi:hypothetical protein
MAETINNAFVTSFSTLVTHLAQQTAPRFAAHTLVQSGIVGERDTFEQMSQTEDREITGERFTPASLEDADHQRRSVWKRDWEWRKGFRTQDELAMLIDPQRNYIRSAAYAAVRRRDRVVLAAVTGTAYTGKNGNTELAFNTSAYTTGGAGRVIDATATGMTEGVFRQMRRIFNETEEMIEDMEGGQGIDSFVAAISPQAHEQLLGMAQTTNSDYYIDPIDGRMPLVKGYIPYFMGFRIRVTNLLTLTSTTRRCLFWHKSAIGMSVWKEMAIDISQRKDMVGLPWQVTVNYSCNAVRLRESAVFAVDITEV